MARSKGGKTASGEHYDPEEMTAAHRTLPFGTIVRVINLRNNKNVTVRITKESRIVDVSRAAAHKLDVMKSGVTRVRVEVIQTTRDSGSRLYISPGEVREHVPVRGNDREVC